EPPTFRLSPWLPRCTSAWPSTISAFRSTCRTLPKQMRSFPINTLSRRATCTPATPPGSVSISMKLWPRSIPTSAPTCPLIASSTELFSTGNAATSLPEVRWKVRPKRKRMIIGVPKEVKDHESRVGITPAGVRALTEAGHKVLVETHAGELSAFTDDDYQSAGAEIVGSAHNVWANAAMIVKVKEPIEKEYGFFR